MALGRVRWLAGSMPLSWPSPVASAGTAPWATAEAAGRAAIAAAKLTAVATSPIDRTSFGANCEFMVNLLLGS